MAFFGITFSNSDMYLLGVAGILCMAVIGTILSRKSSILLRKREERAKTIDKILAPFNDAILNIEHREHNYISIMNSFFVAQEEAVTRAKVLTKGLKKRNIENAWKKYKLFYESNAKGKVIFQFISLPDEVENEQIEILRSHVLTIIKAIGNI